MNLKMKWVMIFLLMTAMIAVFLTSLPENTPLVAGNILGGFSSQFLMNPDLSKVHPAIDPQQDPDGDKLVIAGNYQLGEGEVLHGNLIVLGGTAQLSPGSSVEGDVLIVGGTLSADGNVEGDIDIIGGLISLGSTAKVGGNINSVSAHLNIADGAEIAGNVNQAPTGPFSVILPGTFKLPNWEGVPAITIPGDSPVVNFRINPLWDVLWWIVRSLFWAALAVLVALFTSKSIERIGETAVGNPLASGGLGCITILVAPVILVLLAITICGIPFSVVGGLILWVAWVFGVIVLGTETGKRLAGMFKLDWAIPVSAGIGTFLLTLVANGIQMVVPCIGWLVPLLIGLVGFGAVLLTRFGTQTGPSGNTPQFREPEITPAALDSGIPEKPTASDEDVDHPANTV